jgi:hypothetical protein
MSERCEAVVGCVRCAKPCALVGDLIPADGLCPWCRRDDAPEVTRLAARDKGDPLPQPTMRCGLQPEHFRCQNCGPHVRADEEGICASCGADTTIEPCAPSDKALRKQAEGKGG